MEPAIAEVREQARQTTEVVRQLQQALMYGTANTQPTAQPSYSQEVEMSGSNGAQGGTQRVTAPTEVERAAE